jgi:hypothetical protein
VGCVVCVGAVGEESVWYVMRSVLQRNKKSGGNFLLCLRHFCDPHQVFTNIIEKLSTLRTTKSKTQERHQKNPV